MRILTVFCTVWCTSVAAQPAPGAVVASSAVRDPYASYGEYLDVLRKPASPNVPGKATRPTSVAEVAVNFAEQTALASGPDWEDEAVLERRFAVMRDARNLVSDQRPDFGRRATWLYPEDGCYARAGVAVAALLKDEPAAVPPAKIFLFGNLSVPSPYARIGRTYWWYHVAPLVRVGDRGYVIDPSIEAGRALEVNEWIARQAVRPESTQVAVCATSAYVPTDKCAGPSVVNEARAVADERKFLNLEWTRLIELGRDPETELGERPPWR